MRTDTGLEGVGSGDLMVGFAGHENLFIGRDPLAIERHHIVLGEIFAAKMLERRVMPKNPWAATKAEKWLAKMGARMKPGSRHFDPFGGRSDCANFVNFKVHCPKPKVRIRGERGGLFMRVEIPWDLADKILMLGYLP